MATAFTIDDGRPGVRAPLLPPTPPLVRLKTAAAAHQVFSALTTFRSLQCFMRHQVWCVWDFMVLTKSIQRELQGKSFYWLPSTLPAGLRLINSILDDEETDVTPDGRVMSHFEMFLGAMQQADISTDFIEEFTSDLSNGVPPIEAMERAKAPSSALRFVGRTLEFASAPLHERAGVLHHSREDLIAGMLRGIPSHILRSDDRLGGLADYIDRHVTLDSCKHSAATTRLLDLVTEGSPLRAAEAEAAAAEAVAARIDYLDAIAASLGG